MGVGYCVCVCVYVCTYSMIVPSSYRYWRVQSSQHFLFDSNKYSICVCDIISHVNARIQQNLRSTKRPIEIGYVGHTEGL